MKWLRFAGQYINTGINPALGHRVVTTFRMTNQYNVMPLFGARTTSAASPTSFEMFYISAWNGSGYSYNFRADYGGQGDDTSLPIDFANLPFDARLVFDISFSKTTTVNGASYTAPTNTSGSSFPIYIGTVNNGGTLDTRPVYGDFSEFVIFDANNIELFHGMPVAAGSTEYSTTPAPSNCYYDLVSKTYRAQAGGTGTIGYENEDDNLAASDTAVLQGVDYGLKVMAQDKQSVDYMNSKYPLFGSDISNPSSQFKTYQFTLTGFNSEPSPPYPAYVYDGNWYQGSGTIERIAQTIDTGFKGGTIKSVLLQHSGVQDANFFSRARQRTRFTLDGTNINSLLNPASKVVPGYINLNQSVLYIVEDEFGETTVLSGQFGSANYSTLAGFNGGTLNAMYFTPPQVRISIGSDGILRVKTIVPYNWIQRAFNSSGYIYEARWHDWAWYQGVTVTVTVLNTPYTLE